jgi:hypothetical protein
MYKNLSNGTMVIYQILSYDKSAPYKAMLKNPKTFTSVVTNIGLIYGAYKCCGIL